MKSKLIILTAILVLIASLVAGFFVWWPKINSYFALEEQRDFLEQLAQEKDEYFDKLRSISEKIEDHRETLEKIEAAFPEDPNVSIPPLMAYIIKVSSENGVTLSGLDMGTSVVEEATKGTKELSFGISGSGSYLAFKNLLRSIYKNSRIINVDSVTFSSVENISSKGTVQPKELKESSDEASDDNQQAQLTENIIGEYQFNLSLTTNFYLDKGSQDIYPGAGKQSPREIILP